MALPWFTSAHFRPTSRERRPVSSLPWARRIVPGASSASTPLTRRQRLLCVALIRIRDCDGSAALHTRIPRLQGPSRSEPTSTLLLSPYFESTRPGGTFSLTVNNLRSLRNGGYAMLKAANSTLLGETRELTGLSESCHSHTSAKGKASRVECSPSHAALVCSSQMSERPTRSTARGARNCADGCGEVTTLTACGQGGLGWRRRMSLLQRGRGGPRRDLHRRQADGGRRLHH